MYVEMFFDPAWQEYRSKLISDKIPNGFYILSDRDDKWRWYASHSYFVMGEPKRSAALALKDLRDNLVTIKRKIHNEKIISEMELRK